MSDEAADGSAAGQPAASGGQHRSWVVVLVCGILPAALLAVVVAVPAALWSRPQLDSFGIATMLAMLLAVLGIGFIWFGWVSAWNPAPSRRAGGSSAWIPLTPGEGVGFISTGLAVMAFSAASVIHASVRGSVGAGGSAGLAVSPFLLAGLADYTLRRYGGLALPGDGSPRPGLGLRAGERAVWTGRAHARWRQFLSIPLVGLVGLDLLFRDLTAAWQVAVVLVVVYLLFLTSVRVTVAARGVTVRYGVMRLRLTRIPLRRIASAEAVEEQAGGLPFPGHMLVFGKASVVLRSGPALLLTLKDGKTFVVSVDDAATGAALLNDLITAA